MDKARPKSQTGRRSIVGPVVGVVLFVGYVWLFAGGALQHMSGSTEPFLVGGYFTGGYHMIKSEPFVEAELPSGVQRTALEQHLPDLPDFDFVSLRTGTRSPYMCQGLLRWLHENTELREAQKLTLVIEYEERAPGVFEQYHLMPRPEDRLLSVCSFEPTASEPNVSE